MQRQTVHPGRDFEEKQPTLNLAPISWLFERQSPNKSAGPSVLWGTRFMDTCMDTSVISVIIEY